MTDSECRTDALPTPPREKKQFFPKDNTRDNKKKIIESDDEDEKPNNDHPSPPNINKNFTYNFHSSTVHIGPELTFININTNGKKTKPQVIETPRIKSLKQCSEPITRNDMDFLAEQMCEGWEDTARALGYGDGQIDNFKHMHPGNLKQVKYEFLRDWRENTGRKATVGLLAQTLWDKDQKEVVKLWSEQYKKIN